MSDTFVLATGRTVTVREFVTLACKAAEIDIQFDGTGSESEIGIDAATGKTIVRVNPEFYRPAEVDLLVGNAIKAQETLRWQADTSLEALCTMMVEADLARQVVSDTGMTGKRILVTGSEGFTGVYVRQEFRTAGWEVWGAGLAANQMILVTSKSTYKMPLH